MSVNRQYFRFHIMTNNNSSTVVIIYMVLEVHNIEMRCEHGAL